MTANNWLSDGNVVPLYEHNVQWSLYTCVERPCYTLTSRFSISFFFNSFISLLVLRECARIGKAKGHVLYKTPKLNILRCVFERRQWKAGQL